MQKDYRCDPKKKKKSMKRMEWKMKVKKIKIQWVEIKILKKMKWILQEQVKARIRKRMMLLNKLEMMSKREKEKL
jgi:hypothetical protein